MKKFGTFILAIAVTAFTAVAGDGKEQKTTFEVDTKESKVYWNAAKVSGKHNGHVSIGSGDVYLKGDEVVGAKIKMEMNTIVCSDLSGEWADKLVSHLKSDDFFSVEKFPHSEFKITSLKGDKVVGDLTIKGITNEISFPAQVKVVGEKVTASGTVKIDRTKWDIKYGSGKFFSDLGDRMIDDEFEISFELTANRSANLTSK